jgi:hypothetical protein
MKFMATSKNGLPSGAVDALSADGALDRLLKGSSGGRIDCRKHFHFTDTSSYES